MSADVVAERGARLIKTLGDEVLFVDPSPRRITKIAIELHEAHRWNSDVPRMRIGLATGPVLLRMGDVFRDDSQSGESSDRDGEAGIDLR